MGNDLLNVVHTNMYRNKNRILKKAAVITCAILTAGNVFGNIISKAEDKPYINEVHRQLVTEKRTSATFTAAEDEKLHIDDIMSELIKIDLEDNLYDGASLDCRGTLVLYRKGNEYTLKIEDAYDIGEMEELTDDIIAEVKEMAGEGATDRELFYEYLKFMSEHCYYNDEVKKIREDNEKENQVKTSGSITELYKKDGGLTCTGYATLTYIVANKLGMECRYIMTYDHVFNAVKFKDSDKYITYDLSLEDKYAGIGIILNLYAKVLTLIKGESEKQTIKACNEGVDYRPALIIDDIRQFVYYNK